MFMRILSTKSDNRIFVKQILRVTKLHRFRRTSSNMTLRDLSPFRKARRAWMAYMRTQRNRKDRYVANVREKRYRPRRVQDQPMTNRRRLYMKNVARFDNKYGRWKLQQKGLAKLLFEDDEIWPVILAVQFRDPGHSRRVVRKRMAYTGGRKSKGPDAQKFYSVNFREYSISRDMVKEAVRIYVKFKLYNHIPKIRDRVAVLRYCRHGEVGLSPQQPAPPPSSAPLPIIVSPSPQPSKLALWPSEPLDPLRVERLTKYGDVPIEDDPSDETPLVSTEPHALKQPI